MMKIKLLFVIFVLILLVGCGSKEEVPAEDKELKLIQPTEPEEVEISEPEEDVEEEPEEVKVMDPEIRELLDKGLELKSASYQFYGPESNKDIYEFYIMGDYIKYHPTEFLKRLDLEDSYNSIYIDKSGGTAEAYCDDRQCKVKGKKKDLFYEDVYIRTPIDWLELITYAEKIQDEKIGKRDTWKLSGNDDIVMWVDTYYGVPMQVQVGENMYEFTKMTFNDVEEEDVMVQE